MVAVCSDTLAYSLPPFYLRKQTDLVAEILRFFLEYKPIDSVQKPNNFTYNVPPSEPFRIPYSLYLCLINSCCRLYIVTPPPAFNDVSGYYYYYYYYQARAQNCEKQLSASSCLLMRVVIIIIIIIIIMYVRKTAKSNYQLRHVRPSVSTEQLDSHWANFHEI